MALWDALARLHDMSLVQLLGGTLKPYGAVGYDGAVGCAQAAEEWAKQGFTGIKAKIGDPTVQENVAVVRAMRKAVGEDLAIMVDYNQSLTPAEASAPLLCCTPTAHWLEYADWWNPILRQTLRIENGMAIVRRRCKDVRT